MATSTGYWPTERISDGAPGNGTDEVQTIIKDSTVTGGTFRLSFQGFVTAEIAWDAGTAAVETALNNLPSIAAGGTAVVGVAVTGGALPGTTMTITFSGSNVAKKALPMLVLHLNSLTGGGSMTLAEGTPGVDVFGRGLTDGTQVINGVNGAIYYNNGTAHLPVWATV